MKQTAILALLISSCFTGTFTGQLLKVTQLRNPLATPRLQRRIGPSLAQRPYSVSPTPQLPASASKNIISATCPPEAVGAVCGYVPVSLDRKHPQNGAIQIYFELYPHSNPGPAESALLFNEGGPGAGTTVWRDDAFFAFGSNLGAHDLLLIDDRGRGLSNTIDCPELQHGTARWAQAEADCAAQLGATASSYGTGDIADDTEAVRAALGYDKVDYYGWSYGGPDVVAYATRYGEHLRSIVLDAPFAGAVLNKFDLYDHYRTQQDERMVSLACRRSPTCSVDHSSPNAELNALVSAIRQHPVEGDAYDASGNLTQVHIDEAFLLTYIVDNMRGNFASTGEILAAATSFWGGDQKPLLRLAAETFYTLEGDNGDPAYFSKGANVATFCSDLRMPWEWSATVPDRKAQFNRAMALLPKDYYAPFSKAAAGNLTFNAPKECLWWEKPTPSSPVVPENATYPNVPTLVLSGDMDNGVPPEITRDVAALFPNATLVPVVEIGHGAVWWSPCAANLASQFIETLQVGDTTCAKTPGTVWPAVGRFPLHARDTRAAVVDPSGKNKIGTAERKVVTVAVAAATDALQRSIMGWGDGVGLRGGTFHTDYADVWTTTLTDCAFADDVKVSGTATWFPGFTWSTWGLSGDFTFAADLQVSGSGTSGGSLHVEGTWQAPGKVGTFKVTGMLGGRQVSVLVPEG